MGQSNSNCDCKIYKSSPVVFAIARPPFPITSLGFLLCLLRDVTNTRFYLDPASFCDSQSFQNFQFLHASDSDNDVVRDTIRVEYFSNIDTDSQTIAAFV